MGLDGTSEWRWSCSTALDRQAVGGKEVLARCSCDVVAHRSEDTSLDRVVEAAVQKSAAKQTAAAPHSPTLARKAS
jgi:hypothetical protein